MDGGRIPRNKENKDMKKNADDQRILIQHLLNDEYHSEDEHLKEINYERPIAQKRKRNQMIKR